MQAEEFERRFCDVPAKRRRQHFFLKGGILHILIAHDDVHPIRLSHVRVPLPLAVWSGVLYTVRGIRKFRAIGASLTDETFALPAPEAGSETE